MFKLNPYSKTKGDVNIVNRIYSVVFKIYETKGVENTFALKNKIFRPEMLAFLIGPNVEDMYQG